MLLNNLVLAVVDCVSGDPRRPALNYVHLTNEYAQASDGRVLLRVDLPKSATDADFPIIEGHKPCPIDDPKGLLIDADALKQARKNMPKKARDLPICKHVAVDASLCNVPGGKTVMLCTTDTSSLQTVHADVCDKPIADYDSVWPTKDEANYHAVVVNLSVLEQIVKALKNAQERNCSGERPVRLEFCQSSDKAIKIRGRKVNGQNVVAAIMPMRDNNSAWSRFPDETEDDGLPETPRNKQLREEREAKDSGDE